MKLEVAHAGQVHAGGLPARGGENQADGRSTRRLELEPQWQTMHVRSDSSITGKS
jgi:hypothetical protein